MAKNTTNISVTVNKDLLEDVKSFISENRMKLSTFTNMTYEYFLNYENKKRLRGFELVSEEKRKGNFAKLPTRGSKHSAGYDFYMPEDLTLGPWESSKLIPTNVRAYMQEGEVLKLFVRSSIGIKKNIVLKNITAIIDADYYNADNEGNIHLAFVNLSDKTVTLEKGERVVQGIFETYLESDNCNTKDERKGGIGSTNKIK